MTTRPRIFVGLDLGQAQDFTALVVLQRPDKRHFVAATKDAKPPYDVPFLKRFPLGTSYPDIVAAVVTLLRTPELQGAYLILDRTGVGRAVGDLFRAAQTDSERQRTTSVSITSGTSINRADDGGYNVPKAELVSTTQVLLQTRRLRIAPSLPEAALLVEEFQNFKVKITAAANETFGAWRDGQHDDLVLATALAAWYGERQWPYEKIDDAPHVGTLPAWSTTNRSAAFRQRFRR